MTTKSQNYIFILSICVFIINSSWTLELQITMNRIAQHINIILICINTIGLSAYSHQYIHTHASFNLFLPFLVSFLSLKLYPLMLRSIYCLIAFLALIAVFIQNKVISTAIVSLCLGLTLCVGYHQVNRILLTQDQNQIKIYEGAINISLALGVFLSTANNWIQTTLISAKLMVLITTLANFYIPVPEHTSLIPPKMKEKQVDSKMVYNLTPFYLKQWTYAIGYGIGIYLNTFNIFVPNKYSKYLVAAALLLIEVLTYKTQIKLISQLLRAILIYHFQKHSRVLQAYFIFTFLCLRLYFSQDDLSIFLMVSYLLLALYLWKSQYRSGRGEQLKNSTERPKTQIEMSLIKSSQRYTSRLVLRRNSKI